MLTDTMTIQEIGLELSKDWECLDHRVADIMKRERKKALKNASSFPIYMVREAESNRRNKYFARIRIPSKKALKTGAGVGFGAYLVHNRPGQGTYLYTSVKPGPLNVGEYQPHFFRRYIERTGFQGTTIEAIKELLRQPDALSTSAEYNGVTYVAQAFTNGVGLGVRENGNELMRTFVTYDMLTPTQKQMQEAMTAYLEISDKYRARTGNDVIEQFADLPRRHSEMERYTLIFWEAFGRYHLHKDLEAEKIETARYKLRERSAVEKIERRANRVRLHQQDSMTPKEEKIARMELLIRKFRKYDQERKEYYAKVLKENEHLKALVTERDTQIAQLEAQLRQLEAASTPVNF